MVQTTPSVSISGGSGKEGDDTAISFTVTLDEAATGTVTVDYQTRDGTAEAGDDYTATSGTLTFGAGTTSQNLSVEIEDDIENEDDETFTGADAAALIAAGNTDVADPAQIWGNPTIEDDLKLFGNFGSLLGNGLQFYGHTNYASKRVTEGFYFRNPNNRANIYSLDGGETLLIGDVLTAQGMGSANCPVVRITDNVPDQAALAQVSANPNCFSFREIAPGGFTPQFGGVVTDMSAVTGLRRIADSGLTWDASASYGSHESDFFFQNTVNASLGLDTPRDFEPGLYKQEEVNLNFDVSYAASDMVNFAAGTEWRDEKFTIGAGGRPSWDVGPYAAQGFVSGSNGFPGFPDYTAGAWSRRTARSTETSSCGDATTAGRSAARCVWSTSTCSAPPTARSRPATP